MRRLALGLLLAALSVGCGTNDTNECDTDEDCELGYECYHPICPDKLGVECLKPSCQRR